MKLLKSFFLAALIINTLNAQTIPTNRIYDWKKSGLVETLPAYTNTLNMQTLGADVTGVMPSDEVFLIAINQCTATGQSYTIFFPTGVYTFTNTISIILKNNVKLLGSGANTHLIFKTPNICINIRGTADLVNTYSITQNANKRDTYLKSSANTTSLSVFNTNDFMVLKQRATAILSSTWAYNSVGQFLKVKSSNDDTIKFNHEFRKDYLLADTISLFKATPIQNTGIKCMHITRSNSAVNGNTTIQLLYAYNCFLEGVEVDSCFFSHVTLESSGNCEIRGSYFHDAYDYGGGGRGPPPAPAAVAPRAP